MGAVRPVIVAAAVAAVLGGCAPRSPVRIGVMLPMSGPSDLGLRPALAWAQAAVNDAGGVAGRRIVLEYADLATLTAAKAADRFLADDGIVAVIGPDTSSDVFAVADRFIAARKVLISPSASAGDIFRAFGGRDYFWRTVESDVAQTETMLAHAGERGVRRVALWTDFGPYGATFFDWFGFLARELNMAVVGIVRRRPDAPDCSASLAETVRAQPEVLFVATTSIDDIACLLRATPELSPTTRLFFSDGARYPGLPARLGALAEGMEGTAFAPDPATGFEPAFKAALGVPPPAFAASAYDALVLIAYALERSGGAGGPALAAAIKEVVNGRGAPTGWDKAGIAEALRRLRVGERPDVTGATGPLEYDRDRFTDPTQSTFRIWRVRAGAYETTDYLSRTGSLRAASTHSALRTLASERNRSVADGGANDAPPVAERSGLWALVAALSTGWENYRHQADALAMYQVLRSRGVPDARIILVVEDDLAGDPRNPDGTVRNVAGGPDLRAGAEIDYRPSQLGRDDLRALLEGRPSAATPAVLGGGAGDDALVYLVGHGGVEGLHLGAEDATGRGGTGYLDAPLLRQVFNARRSADRHRRLLVVVEACHAGVLESGVAAPGALLVAAASPTENSFSANWDAAGGLWRADQFSWELYRSLSADPTRSITEWYTSLYFKVPGSHVTLYNAARFGNPRLVPVADFISP